MRIDEWWPDLIPSTRQWLIDNAGDAVPPEILEQITAVTGEPGDDDTWVGEGTDDEFYLSDEATDWVEAMGNAEGDEDEDDEEA